MDHYILQTTSDNLWTKFFTKSFLICHINPVELLYCNGLLRNWLLATERKAYQSLWTILRFLSCNSFMSTNLYHICVVTTELHSSVWFLLLFFLPSLLFVLSSCTSIFLKSWFARNVLLFSFTVIRVTWGWSVTHDISWCLLKHAELITALICFWDERTNNNNKKRHALTFLRHWGSSSQSLVGSKMWCRPIHPVDFRAYLVKNIFIMLS